MTTTDTITTVVRFTVVDPDTGLSFTDAISIDGNLTDTELKRAMAGIEREKTERFDAWKAAISTPAPAPVAELAQVAEQAAVVESQVSAIDAEDAADADRVGG